MIDLKIYLEKKIFFIQEKKEFLRGIKKFFFKKYLYNNFIINKYTIKYSPLLNIIFKEKIPKDDLQKKSFKIQNTREKNSLKEEYQIKKKIKKKMKEIFNGDENYFSKEINFLYKKLENLKKNKNILQLSKKKYLEYEKIILKCKYFYKKVLKLERKLNKIIHKKIYRINLLIDKISFLNKKINQCLNINKNNMNHLLYKKNKLIDAINKIIGVKFFSEDSEKSIRIFDNILLISNKLFYHIKNNHEFLHKKEGNLSFVNKLENTIDIPLKEIHGGGSLSGLVDVYLNDIIPTIENFKKLISSYAEIFYLTIKI